jgi:hypothetical protein
MLLWKKSLTILSSPIIQSGANSRLVWPLPIVQTYGIATTSSNPKKKGNFVSYKPRSVFEKKLTQDRKPFHRRQDVQDKSKEAPGGSF